MQPLYASGLGKLSSHNQGRLTLKARTLLLITLIPLFLALQACGSWWLPRPHKIEIQQGNLLTPEIIDQISVGMSEGAVKNLLGSPLTSNQINPDRWEYIYSVNRSGDKPKVQRLSVVFENMQVKELEKDGLPSSEDK